MEMAMAMAGSSLTLSFVLPLLFTMALAMDCNGGDRAGLLKVKEQLGNPVELSSWLPATNCCAWDPSVICSDADRVYLVALFSLNVTAPVPPAFGDLPELQTIQLEKMPGLSGPIPSSFDKLSHLELLSIDGTSVSGPVPDFLAKTNLSALVITNSKLASEIPRSLSRLRNLRYLDLSGNALTGSIPPGLLHGSYRFLILSNNQLAGEIPREYGGDGRNLETIDLSHNRLTGDPSFLFGAGKPTTKIDLSSNELRFDMTGVRFPYHLTYLDLSHNRITGRVAKSLKDVKLEHFDVSYNELCGEIPAGRFMARHGPECYAHNRCLCGAPLPPCKRGL